MAEIHTCDVTDNASMKLMIDRAQEARSPLYVSRALLDGILRVATRDTQPRWSDGAIGALGPSVIVDDDLTGEQYRVVRRG